MHRMWKFAGLFAINAVLAMSLGPQEAASREACSNCYIANCPDVGTVHAFWSEVCSASSTLQGEYTDPHVAAAADSCDQHGHESCDLH